MDTKWIIVEDHAGKVVHEEPFKGRSYAEVKAALKDRYTVTQYRLHSVSSDRPTATPAKDGLHKGWDTDALRAPAHSLSH